MTTFPFDGDLQSDAWATSSDLHSPEMTSPKNHIYIMELSQDTVKILAQAIHICLMSDPDSKQFYSALQELNVQTDVVSMEPLRHKVYKNEIEVPYTSKIMKPITYIPYEGW